MGPQYELKFWVFKWEVEVGIPAYYAGRCYLYTEYFVMEVLQNHTVEPVYKATPKSGIKIVYIKMNWTKTKWL